MAIGAISGYSAVNYDPYIYNSRQVSAASMNAIKPISDDATEGGVDFSAVSDKGSQENINPLRPGQTQDFAGVLMSQMAQSSIRQYQLMGEATKVPTEAEAQAPLVADLQAS